MDDSYYVQYQKLHELICLAYYDDYMLQEIGRYNELISSGKGALCRASYDVMSHISELLKGDLALSLWKVSMDTNPKACTIGHLRSYIINANRSFADKIQARWGPRPAGLDTTKEQIRLLRQSYLAHRDKASTDASVELSQMEEFLQYAKDCLNALCFQEIDERVTPITQAKLSKM